MDEPNVIENWTKERILGSGSFGVVTLWRNIVTDDQIAIKKCKIGMETILTDKHRERWTKEVEIMQRINNANIVSFKKLPDILDTILQKYNTTKLPMLSMEFCTKGDLRQILNRSENCCGILESDCRDILFDMKNAIEYLHSMKIIHRDLKPENIVLQVSNYRTSGIIYKLIDLGYAKEIDETSICGSIVGTLQYLAPELLYSKSYSNSVDYWSFGILAFEVICGLRPFLHNFESVNELWMRSVKEKNPEHICIYETDDKNIIRQEHIYAENHISREFQSDIEKWLRQALEWNPKKRGRTQDELTIFTSLQKILSLKIITIFSVSTYEFLSYKIDDDTSIRMIQEWMERDIKLSKSDQFLLNAQSDEINSDDLAQKHFIRDSNDPMIYLFHKEKILDLDNDIIPRVPKLTKVILENPSKKMPYYHLKRAHAQSLYFIYQETHLYNVLLDACTIKIQYLSKKFEQTKNKISQMNQELSDLEAQRDFAAKSLEIDINRIKTLEGTNSKTVDLWSGKITNINTEISTLKKAISQIIIRFKSAFKRVTNLSENFTIEFSKERAHDLNMSLDDALNCYADIKTVSKHDAHSMNFTCNFSSIVKIIYNSLKRRDFLLRNSDFHKYLQQIIDLTKELEKILIPITSASQLITKFKSALLTAHCERQNEIWDRVSVTQSSNKILIRPTEEPKSLRSIKSEFSLGSNVKNAIEETQSTRSYTLEKPLNFITGDPAKAKVSNQSVMIKSFENGTNGVEERIATNSSNGYHTLSCEAADIINENVSIRQSLEEKLMESVNQHISFLKTDLNFDLLVSESSLE